MSTWILTAHRGGACLYGQPVPGAKLQRLETIDHPEGRLQDSELNTDRYGRAFDSGGHGRRAMATEQRPHERVAEDFARSLADDLNHARMAGRFDDLILVAEPTMLGLLRQSLDDTTSKHLKGTIDKSYGPEDESILSEALAEAYLKLPEN